VPLSQRILAWLATRDPAAIRQPARRSTLQPPGRRKDLDAIREATIQAAPAIRVLILNDVPRTALSTSEVAEITGMPYTRVLAEIRVGRIRVITGGNQYAQRDHPSARSRSCTGSSPSQTDGAGADIPSRRRACLVAGQEQSPYGATWAAERHGSLLQVCYAFGAGAMGYARSCGAPTPFPGEPWDDPRGYARQRRLP
jgi:hypothetical protein